MEQCELDKITQLLKTGECSNQILAIQLAVGQGLSIDEIVELCLCLENVVYSNGGTELILCDYGIIHEPAQDLDFVHVDRFSLIFRDEYLDDINDCIPTNISKKVKIQLLKEIIESVI